MTDTLRCPVCRRPYYDAVKALLIHLLEEHPTSDEAINVRLESLFIEAGVSL